MSRVRRVAPLRSFAEERAPQKCSPSTAERRLHCVAFSYLLPPPRCLSLIIKFRSSERATRKREDTQKGDRNEAKSVIKARPVAQCYIIHARRQRGPGLTVSLGLAGEQLGELPRPQLCGRGGSVAKSLDLHPSLSDGLKGSGSPPCPSSTPAWTEVFI